jgi:hypothetical protein
MCATAWLLGAVVFTQTLALLPLQAQLKAEELKRIPIVINSYNRVSCLKRLVEFFHSLDQHNIIILDNNSTHPPLLRYYQELEAARKSSTCGMALCPATHSDHGALVVRLRQNLGHRALWLSGIGEALDIFTSYYLYTDPDILPVDGFPRNFVAIFLRILLEYPTATKVGCALKIDDLPDSYVFKKEVIRWEEEFWSDWRVLPLPPSLAWLEKDRINPTKIYQGDIDTTFAIYREGTYNHTYGPAIRVGGRFEARHLPWYSDSTHPTQEDTYYTATAQESGFWTKTTQNELAARMTEGAGQEQAPGTEVR